MVRSCAMRLWIWCALGVVVASGAVASGMALLGTSEPPAAPLPADNLALTSGISVATTAVVPLPEPAPPPSEQPANEAAPAGPGLSELPVQDVDPLPVHAVPDAVPAPVPHVTIQDQQGRSLGRVSAPAPPPPSYVPSVGPAPNYSPSRAPPPSYQPSVGPPLSNAASSTPPTASPPKAGTGTVYLAPAPPPPSYRPSVGPALGSVAPASPSAPLRAAEAEPVQQAAAPATAPRSLSGPAHATGTVSLAVDGHSVRLYGVQPPISTDRCALGTGAPQRCSDVTEAVLAAKLAHTPSVTCQAPPGAGAAESARICRDAAGIDIAGFLVSEGLATADQRTSTYASAESTARAQGRGLWRFR